MYIRRQIGRCVLLCAAACAFASAQTSRLPSIVIAESQQGVKISALGGALPNARVLRLSNPDRLVLDFDQTELRMSTAEREMCAAHGVRVGFHTEGSTTRVVFDIPVGQQRWMKMDAESVVVEYRSLLAKGGSTPPRASTGTPAVVPQTPSAMAEIRAPRHRASSAEAQTRISEPLHADQREGRDTRLEVISSDGLLQVSARGVPFKEILDKVATASGASVQVMTPVEGGKNEIFEYGPAPAMEVIRKLFEGSNYNYLVISEPNSSTRISRIVVTSALRYLPGNDGPVSDDDSNPESLKEITPITPKQGAAEDKKPD